MGQQGILYKKKELKSDVLYKKIKQMIISNELKQGMPLSERKLCTELNASRTPVREALKKLNAENFIDYRHEYGASVSVVTYQLVVQIYDIREMLEALAVRLFTATVTDEQLGVIRRLQSAMEEATKEHRYSESLQIDLRFHHYIISETKSQYLQKLLHSIFEQTSRIINLTSYSDDWAKESLEAHMRILAFIENRDSDSAEREMRFHSQRSKQHQLDQWIQNNC